MLKPFKNKNKFIIQNRVNLWNNSQIIDSKKFKWRFFNQGLNKKQVFGNFYNRGAKQIRFLYKNLLRFHQLLRISHGKIKKKEIDRYFFKFKKYPSRFLFFINAVESRLDVALYRTGIFKNIFELRQLISHSKIRVDGRVVNSSSFQLSPNNIVEIKAGSKILEPKQLITKVISQSFEFNYNVLKGYYINKFTYKNIPYFFGKNKKLIALLYKK